MRLLRTTARASQNVPQVFITVGTRVLLGIRRTSNRIQHVGKVAQRVLIPVRSVANSALVSQSEQPFFLPLVEDDQEFLGGRVERQSLWIEIGKFF